MATDYNDGLWHGWNGGECPVHPQTVVDAIFGDGGKQPKIKGEHLDWSGPDRLPRSHVAAFRVVKEHREPREFWALRGLHGSNFGMWDNREDAEDCQLDHPHTEIIHLREVLPEGDAQ